jgi:F1F0 ATPase subunit 2
MNLAEAYMGGTVLGLFYFASLWWTVRRIVLRRHAALFMAGSYMLRIAVLATGVLLLGQGAWYRFAACLAGLLTARLLSCQPGRYRIAETAGKAGEERIRWN